MSRFLILAFLFFMGCIFGWGLEVFYRRFVTNREKKLWINPGFLVGPYLPLYGFGLCTLYYMASLERYIHSKFVLFAMMAVLMTVLEYIAGVIFIKGLRVKLWDYSDRKFNFEGIICPLFSFFWAVLGAVYYFFIHPHILDALKWLSENLAFSFVIGMFYGIFLIDVVYSLNLVTKIRAFAKEKQIIVRYEALKQEITSNAAERKARLPFFFVIKSPNEMKEHFSRYLDIEIAFKEQEFTRKYKRYRKFMK